MKIFFHRGVLMKYIYLGIFFMVPTIIHGMEDYQADEEVEEISYKDPVHSRRYHFDVKRGKKPIDNEKINKSNNRTIRKEKKKNILPYEPRDVQDPFPS